ncbi:MAG: putative transposase, partial [Dermatophilaceae bacterium]
AGMNLNSQPSPTTGGLRLRLQVADGQTLVTLQRSVLYRYDSDDTGMRNLAIVALTDAGRRVDEVAAAFGLTATYVSMLRGRARADGSAGLVRPRGRPPKLSDRQVRQARDWLLVGWTQQAIADRFGVARSVISELRARLGPVPVQDALPEPLEEPTEPAVGRPTEQAAEEAGLEVVPDEPAPAEAVPAEHACAGTVFAGTSRVGTGTRSCRYAGAMLLHAYLDRVGAQTIFATVTGGMARRYDDLAVLSTATLGFALGIDTVEGVKHLRRAEAGPAVGLTKIPELKTLRTRLAALADGTDPLRVQRAFAAGMLASDPAGDPVYFVDDHFVPYAGARPVGKGWNTKRRHAQPGRDDTLLVDARGRAVVFATGEPTGLCSTLPGVLAQLRAVIGPDAPVLLGFDRGGAYRVAFTACREAGADWVTYRRAPLAETTATPKRSWTVRDGKRVAMVLADETVHLTGYGKARQLTLYENDQPVLQVLTSELTATGADLLCWLRSRWRIENMFKYASEHNGIDALADYRMDITPDTRMVANPARVAARKQVKDAENELAAAERALPQLLNGEATPKQLNAALPGAHARIRDAQAALQAAKAVLKPIPAKVAAAELDPNAKRARPVLARRGLQMVLRLLAFNAEAWLAEHLNAYLADPDEYRAITRNLLHQGGQIHYSTTGITVTLDRPDTPPHRPCPEPAHRRTQRDARPATRRPPPDHLSRPAGMNLNTQPSPTTGDLSLPPPSLPPPSRSGPNRSTRSRWPHSRVCLGSPPARSGAGTPGRCCCMPTWTGSTRRPSSPPWPVARPAVMTTWRCCAPRRWGSRWGWTPWRGSSTCAAPRPASPSGSPRPAAGHLPGPAVRPRGRLGPTRGAAGVRRADAGRRPGRAGGVLRR